MVLVFLSGLVILQSVSISVCTVFPKDAEYLGCSSTNLVRSNEYYKIKHALPWNNGVTVCIERLTVYVGVQREQGNSDDYLFYCGNDLLDHSEWLNSSECQSCSEDEGIQCGGLYAMSLYRLRESTPLQLLLATGSSGIRVWTEDNLFPTVKVTCSSPVNNVDYIYSDDEIYFGYSRYWAKSFYNYFSLKYTFPITVDDLARSGVADLTNDWTRKKIYASSKNTNNLYEMHVNDEKKSTMFGRSKLMRDMTIDPYEGKIFFVESTGKLFSASLVNKSVSSFGILNATDLRKLAVDTNEQLIYIVGKTDGQDTIMRVDYTGSMLKLVLMLSGAHLLDVRSIDVYNNILVWVNYAEGQYTVYKCQLIPKCEVWHKLYQSSEAINDVKIYNPERQTPGRKYLCRDLNCSHDCVKVSLFVARCTCPPGKQLSHDGKTCQEEPTTIPTTAVSFHEKLFNREQITLDTESKQTTVGSEVLTEESSRLQQNKEKDNGRLFEKLQSIHEHLEKAHKETRHGNNFTEVFLLIVGVLTVVFLASITFMLVKLHRQGVKRSKPTELMQVTSTSPDMSECLDGSGFFHS